MHSGSVIPTGRVAADDLPRKDVGRVTELVIPPVPRVLSREQGFGELKSRAPPPPGVRDPRSTVPQLVARGEAGEDGTGKEKKAFLGKGETVQAVQGFHAWSRGAWSEAISARVKGLGGPGNGFSRSHGHAWGTDGLGWAVHSW